MKNLNEKNIWLIGGSTGIGEELAKTLAPEVKNLCISARSENKLVDLVSQISCKNVFSVACSIDNLESVRQAYSKIKSRLGHIDTVILNAAVYHVSDAFSFNLDEHIEQINVNYIGNLNIASQVLPDFIKNSSGHFVVISSQSAFRSLPKASGYGASKSALTYFFESLRMQLEDAGIEISLLYPGFVKTRLTEKNDFKMPFLMEVKDAADKIFQIVKKGKGDLGFPIGLSLPIQILRLLPEKIYRFIVKKALLGK